MEYEKTHYSYRYRDHESVHIPYAKMQSSIEGFKTMLIKFDEDEIPEGLNSFDELVFLNVYRPYQEYLLKENLVDFGDLLLHMVDIFKRFPVILNKFREKFRYILVDEVQDLNKVQQEWLKLVVGSNPHLTCVGDDD